MAKMMPCQVLLLIETRLKIIVEQDGPIALFESKGKRRSRLSDITYGICPLVPRHGVWIGGSSSNPPGVIWKGGICKPSCRSRLWWRNAFMLRRIYCGYSLAACRGRAGCMYILPPCWGFETALWMGGKRCGDLGVRFGFTTTKLVGD